MAHDLKAAWPNVKEQVREHFGFAKEADLERPHSREDLIAKLADRERANPNAAPTEDDRKKAAEKVDAFLGKADLSAKGATPGQSAPSQSEEPPGQPPRTGTGKRAPAY